MLRSVSRDRAALSWPSRANVSEHLSIVLSHPRWLVDRWLQRYGEQATESWLAFNNEPAAMCLSVNRHVTTRDALAGELADIGVKTEPTARAANGLRVIEGRPLGTDAFTQGRFVVQDEASQLIGELASPPAGAKVLDLCASPGGKTVMMSADVRPARFRRRIGCPAAARSPAREHTRAMPRPEHDGRARSGRRTLAIS